MLKLHGNLMKIKKILKKIARHEYNYIILNNKKISNNEIII